ncbi:hypothetical protein CHS0354_042845 [Potamilus streckersoni]|uniref:GB1/RHD3-type G domain-containing protein n=1 Tax=Potamilus streckersoni TaxID=2493646 RepID=A0AAE0W6E7_9BIVA|nr:hypothetical protein CHS0354_042845 [Potamilus streckersoni]
MASKLEPADKYEYLTVFQRPCCLIGTGRGDALEIDPKVLQEIQCVKEELVVVAIAGPYRTGKSYLLNRLSGHNCGFPLGSTIESVTKGLWVWCLMHPKKKGKVMLLLDTEGLGDIKKGNPKHDVWILTLALLLCSTLVYNVLAVLSQDLVEKLDLVAEVAKKLVDKRSSDVKTFPDLIISLRDFTLDLSIDEREVSPDEYFEHSLELRPDDGADENVKAYNDQRNRIKNGFPRRKCFTFERPAQKNVLTRLSEVTDEELDSDFVQQTVTFCNFIFENSPVKLIDVNIPTTGRNFGDLAESYVSFILQGDLPNFYDTLEALSIKECQRAADESIAMYIAIMFASIEIPTQTLDTLNAAHERCLEKVLEIFRGRAMNDENGEFMEKLVVSLSQEFEHIYQENKEESIRRSRKLLQELYAPLAEKLLSGEYNKRYGFLEYSSDRCTMEESYVDHLHVLGYKATEVFQEFERDKEIESEMLEQLNLKITEHAIHMEDLQEELNQINKQAQLQTRVSLEEERHIQERREHFQRQLRELEENHSTELQRTQQALQNRCSEALSRQRDQMNREHEGQLEALRRQLR